MKVRDITDSYFDWMYSHVMYMRPADQPTYYTLLDYLHTRIFTYILPMDANRLEDGVDLRYRFGYECGYSDVDIAHELDIHPCSVLEMMVALAIRCEEHIMEDAEYGDRTPQWFWTMITNLGLNDMYDGNFDQDYVDRVIDRFLNRDYKRNGEGGLFRLERSDRDMRTADIWYQMNWYLSELIEKEG